VVATDSQKRTSARRSAKTLPAIRPAWTPGSSGSCTDFLAPTSACVLGSFVRSSEGKRPAQTSVARSEQFPADRLEPVDEVGVFLGCFLLRLANVTGHGTAVASDVLGAQAKQLVVAKPRCVVLGLPVGERRL
jgi:hypothetical protein